MRPPRVLVADDEKTIALTLTEILFREGYRVATCFSGEEAVEKAAEFLPDLFLSDISMGRMNGVEAAARITAKLPQCKVLFHSGHIAFTRFVDHLPQNLVYSFMPKPAHLPDMLDAIACMLPNANTVEDKADADLMWAREAS